jgi:hypothetical protein
MSLRKPLKCGAEGRAQAALAIVATDRGKVEMDASATARSHAPGRKSPAQTRLARWTQPTTALASGVLSGLLGAAADGAVFILIRRAHRARARQEWLQSGQVGLSDAMMGDKSVEELATAS